MLHVTRSSEFTVCQVSAGARDESDCRACCGAWIACETEASFGEYVLNSGVFIGQFAALPRAGNIWRPLRPTRVFDSAKRVMLFGVRDITDHFTVR